VNQGQLTDASDSTRAVGTAMSVQTYDLGFIMSNMDGEAQLEALNSLDSASFVDNTDNYRQYTVTGFQLGGYKRSELKLYTSVGHILEYVRGKGLRVYTETGATDTCNCTRPESRRSLLSTLTVNGNVYDMDFSTLGKAHSLGATWESAALRQGVSANTAGTIKAYDLKDGSEHECTVSDAKCIRDAMFGFGSGTDGSAISVNSAGLTGFATWMSGKANQVRFKANLQQNVDAGIHNGLYQFGTALQAMDAEEFAEFEGMLRTDHVSRENAYTTLLGGAVNTQYDTISKERDVHVRAYNYVGSYYFMHDMAANDEWRGNMYTVEGTGSGFACTGTTGDSYTRSNTDMAEGAWTTCKVKEDGGNMVGGYFFSSALGTYEAFLTLLPAKYCDFATTKESKDDLSDRGFYGFFLYYLHGWGESAGALVELKTFLQQMQTGMVHGDIVLVAPDDNATPFGGRTWYRNSDFTGYHMDMIAWELPNFIADSTGLTSYANGLFGCSMGGAGSLNILMTYPSKYVGAIPFNAPTETNECILYSVCHLECMVDAYMCELIWTSPGVAYSPYVIVTTGNELSTTGYYQPFALGIAERTKSQTTAVGTCSDVGVDKSSRMTTIATGTGGRLHNSAASEGKSTATDVKGEMGISTWVYRNVAATGTTMFWLDPIWFTVVTQGFYPTHNIYTDAADCPQVVGLLDKQPLFRLNFDGVVSGLSNSFIFMSTDSNDEFGISTMAHNFVRRLKAVQTTGSFYEDTFGDGGHTMSVRDFKTAMQFFSDVIANGITVTRAEYTVKGKGQCPTYLKRSEISVTALGQSNNAVIHYAPGGTCVDSQTEFDWTYDCGQEESRCAYDCGDDSCRTAVSTPAVLVEGKKPVYSPQGAEKMAQTGSNPVDKANYDALLNKYDESNNPTGRRPLSCYADKVNNLFLS